MASTRRARGAREKHLRRQERSKVGCWEEEKGRKEEQTKEDFGRERISGIKEEKGL